MDHGRDAYLADFYTLELRQLGRDGFADWLGDSFRGLIAAPRSPHFQVDELSVETFGEVFSRISPYLAPGERKIAADAVSALLARGAGDFSKYEGVFSIARIAEGLGQYECLGRLHEVLDKKLRPGAAGLQFPDSELEVYCLRETLECFFRTALHRPEYVKRVCLWAYEFFQSGLPGEVALKPVLAPAYVLARIQLRDAIHSEGQKEYLAAGFKSKLLAGYYASGTPFEDLYEFHSKGERYPYDIVGLGERIDTWLCHNTEPQLFVLIDLEERFNQPLDVMHVLQTATRPRFGGLRNQNPEAAAGVTDRFIEARIPAFAAAGFPS